MGDRDIVVRAVTNFVQKRAFIAVPWTIHAHDPNWIPPLRQTVAKMLNTRKHPFYQQAELALWIAYEDNQPLGRIAAILNHRHNQYNREQTVFWGFFESVNCSEVAAALFLEVELWARTKNAQQLKGPVNLSLNYECGMQISAFDSKPFLMMTQNPEYYPQLIESLEHRKAIDTYAWLIDYKTINIHPRISRIRGKLLDNPDIVMRPINMKNYYKDAEMVIEIYNDAWADNWGFVPQSAEELHYMIKELKNIIISKLAYIITVQGEPAAFSVCLPNINQVLHTIPNGKLLPTGLFKLLWYLKSRKINMEGRIPLLGIKKKFSHLPLGSMLYAKYGEVCAELEMGNIECSWILETNKSMNFALKHINAKPYKTYRIYEKML
ncbi:hypothetical protein BN59_01405 [Legionella massiliensis]|uniref:N-acetyltransferase domain-containing protein n=1 Tax=Legionella massiliensis TaxID=1034943 RepID=A0A078KZF0_9GAMM|nr:hypothetical protein [Legionella massiliensis]CDZ77123.1 hypothetical protein BN59_01405 [Legionella massiliensis]CEE12861.1 hypothetical protein BN1094_01405 [Legionella massiliensis]